MRRAALELAAVAFDAVEWMRALALAAAFLALAATSGAAAKPPSFALWVVHWSGVSNQAILPQLTDCQKRFPSDDLKQGECDVRAVLAAYPPLVSRWEREVAHIAKPQTPLCKAAIHGYFAATLKTFRAYQIYLSGHRHMVATSIPDAMKEEPLATLNSLGTSATRRATRVCG